MDCRPCTCKTIQYVYCTSMHLHNVHREIVDVKHLNINEMCNKVNSDIFARVLFSRNFVKIKPTQNGEITLSFTDIVKPCPSREFLASQICHLMLFAKIKFPRKFPNLQYKV